MPFRDPLTGINADALPLARLNPRRKRDECECNENEPRPSSVVAKVRQFSRRMSQWSLDNLKRGR